MSAVPDPLRRKWRRDLPPAPTLRRQRATFMAIASTSSQRSRWRSCHRDPHLRLFNQSTPTRRRQSALSPKPPQPTTPPRLIFPGRPAQTSSVFLIVIVTVVVTVAVLGICAVVAYCFCLRAKQVADGELPSSKADSRVSQGSVVAGNGNGSRQRTSQPSKGDMASKADPSRRASIALPAMPESDRASLRESQRRSTSQVSKGSDVVYKAEL